MRVRLAVVQFQPAFGEVETNLRRMTRFVERAAKQEADVVVFPENFLTGPVRGRPELIDGKGVLLNAVRQIARQHGIDVLAGSFVERRNGRNYNTSYYIDRTGRVLGRYDKINLWLPERDYIASGRVPCMLQTRYATVGLSICWDLAFPELYRFYARRGVQIVLSLIHI
ncbi:MAG: carbon-nitrogen hydrolase family protein, partial [Kiritimatiellae bacterium]|nr:carbon-nitrogen hydrolase family protein [Kiritimatiellia bacterium]